MGCEGIGGGNGGGKYGAEIALCKIDPQQNVNFLFTQYTILE